MMVPFLVEIEDKARNALKHLVFLLELQNQTTPATGASQCNYMLFS